MKLEIYQGGKELMMQSPAGTLSPIETLYELNLGPDLPLNSQIERIYGHLNFPEPTGKPYVVSNFVMTIDGVITLNIPGHSGGGDISGFNRQDRFIMGLLRAISDVVIVTSHNLEVAPKVVWTPESAYPEMAESYQALRIAMKKKEPPVTVIITARGEVNLNHPVFQSRKTQVVILTTEIGASKIASQGLAGDIKTMVVSRGGKFSALQILSAIEKITPAGFYLLEAGPHLHAEFMADGCLNELFLTLSPQIAGRLAADARLGLVSGKLFAPDNPLWERLYSIKRGENHLFLRYGFPSTSRI